MIHKRRKVAKQADRIILTLRLMVILTMVHGLTILYLWKGQGCFLTLGKNYPGGRHPNKMAKLLRELNYLRRKRKALGGSVLLRADIPRKLQARKKNLTRLKAWMRNKIRMIPGSVLATRKLFRCCKNVIRQENLRKCLTDLKRSMLRPSDSRFTSPTMIC